MKTAAAYIRVSTDDQLEYSPDSQLEKIRAYAMQNSMALPEKFIFREEEGVSGKKAAKRPAFLRMIGTAKKNPKPFDVIIVWKFSRFARSRQDSIVYKSMLRRQCGIDVVSVTEQLGNDKMAILAEAMIEAMDEYYSINLAEEVKRGMNEKVRRGEPVAAPAFGYIMKDKQYSIDPSAAPLIKMIYRDYISGMGLRSIAAKLNAMGIRTKRGGLWENRTVEYILRNPVYIGKIRWNPERWTRRNYDDPDIVVIDGSHEHLIDDETWQKVQERSIQNKMIYGKYAGQKKTPGFMLQGIVRCSNCGSALTRASGASVQCQAYAHGKCRVSHSIRLQKLEEMVLTTIEHDLKFGDIQLVRKAEPTIDYESAIIENQLNKERQKLVRTKEAYESGVDSLEEYRVSKQRILETIRRLKSEKSDLQPRQAGDCLGKSGPVQKNIIRLLRDENVSPEEKNILLRTFVNKIVFDKANSRIQIFYRL